MKIYENRGIIEVVLEIKKRDGEIWELEIEKEYVNLLNYKYEALVKYFYPDIMK